MNGSEQRDSKSSQADTQRTIRVLIIVIATLILGLYAISTLNRSGRGGKVEVDVGKGKIALSVNEPIVDQAKVKRLQLQSQGKTIQYTEGIITDPSYVEALNDLNSTRPTQFSGKNFINREAGFLFTVEHPESWLIQYDPAGMSNVNIAVNTIYNSEGSNLKIGVSRISRGVNIQQFVAANIRAMIQIGAIQQMPVVSYDPGSETAFAIFTNPVTRGQSFQKVVIDRQRDRVFVASANYSQYLSTPAAIRDLIEMIATFTVIGE